MTELTVSIHQPAYLPWLGYFERIAKSDLFVFLDTVQFQKSSFQNRNRIRTAQGETWLTVPVKHAGHMAGTLADLEINTAARWRVKHLRTLEQAYARAPHFEAVMTWLRPFYETEQRFLSELCLQMLHRHLEAGEIKTPVVRASELDGLSGRKSDLLLSILEAVGARTYLSGPMGADYLDVNAFKSKGVDIDVHRFEHPHYVQRHQPFMPGMAGVDRLFCEGWLI